MGDPEPVLVLDEEVPEGPVNGGGGEAGHLFMNFSKIIYFSIFFTSH